MLKEGKHRGDIRELPINTQEGGSKGKSEDHTATSETSTGAIVWGWRHTFGSQQHKDGA